MPFKLVAPYQPAGDQPKAISELIQNIHQGVTSQVLLGVTGSGKTFTIANTIQAVHKPTLVISHNKTLAAQLYSELRDFFPDNAVEYFVSYYDYYQPEVYLPTTGTYIEKELAINDELERLRLSAISALLSDRQDVIVVASVSCIYGISKPEIFKQSSYLFKVGAQLSRNDFLRLFIDMLYSRNDMEFSRGHFRVKGDTVDLFVAYADYAYRFIFWGDELEAIYIIDPSSGKKKKEVTEALVFPANLFVTSKDILQNAIKQIQDDLHTHLIYLEELGKLEEAQRLKERTELDLEMLRELGYCSGIENYSRYIDGRNAGERPYCLLDYFPKDYLMVIDESHVTIPQFKAMWRGDKARKTNLVEHGFRLPAAIDNRPLNFDEFEKLIHQVIFVSATPAAYELTKSTGILVEQIIRPTGLIDPHIEVKPTTNQIHDILTEINQTIQQRKGVLITTLTKRMAEELTAYLVQANIHCKYIHSEIKTLDRVVLLNELRNGTLNVLVGVNLLREGLDLPQAALMIILDADKEGFLRNVSSLIQMIGRVARHEQGRVIMYANTTTASMKQAIDETQRRRSLQMEYNINHHIKPKSVCQKQTIIHLDTTTTPTQTTYTPMEINLTDTVNESTISYGRHKQETLQKQIEILEQKMFQAATALEFIEADRLKETINRLKEALPKKNRQLQKNKG